MARDDVAQMLASNEPTSAAQLARLRKLDERLGKQAEQAHARQWANLLEPWVQSAHPAATTWWWQLDQPIHLGAVSWAVASLLLAIAFGLIVEVVQTLHASGPNSWGTILTVLAGVLFAGGTFTETGREVVQRAMHRVGVRPRGAAAALFGVSLLAVVGAWFLPAGLSSFYTWRATSDGTNLTAQIGDWEKVVALNPNDYHAQYELGLDYQRAAETDKAYAAYQAARHVQPENPWPAIDMAELDMAQKNSFASALPLLYNAHFVADTHRTFWSPWMWYTIYKDLGWAYLQVKQIRLAAPNINTAIKEQAWRPGAHCLLAQLDDAMKKGTQGLAQWRICMSSRKNDLESWDQEWTDTGKLRLAGGSSAGI
jgi:hypothetical protein